MKGSLKKNIYKDPLTGFPNFFKFVEEDTADIFGHNGSVILLDICSFMMINEKYGKDMGDMCLESLGKAIKSELIDYKDKSFFRTDGDEFTVILPNISSNKAKNVASSIRKTFKNIVKDHGILDIDVHTLVLDYHDEISSITDFYHMIFNYTPKGDEELSGKFREGPWVENIISSFIRRIKDTLLLVSDTYDLALTDDISRLPNHRAAKVYLEELINKSKTNNNDFSILFVDGDNLKRYNDISYETGNEMIRDLSEIISNSLRKSDKVFRWLTGDEFLVVLDNVKYKDACNLAERIRSAVEEETRAWIYPITVSIGVSSYRVDGSTIEELINKAEKANSFAKNTGKNKVVNWNEVKSV